jgi:hypothetical protein
MGRAVIGGVLTSTLLTLVVVPVAYTYLDSFGKRCARFFKGKHDEEHELHEVKKKKPKSPDQVSSSLGARPEVSPSANLPRPPGPGPDSSARPCAGLSLPAFSSFPVPAAAFHTRSSFWPLPLLL